ncbi:IS110 family transposase [Streptomyces sp. NPDC058655]|uniref:IS110 family transposase n=1 Tax=Streptomyces sp. NPDC058655 TaxID=3346577 RepID=UPI0036464D58
MFFAVFDKPLPNSEPKLRAVFDSWPRSSAPSWRSWTSPPRSGALPLTVARDAGCQVAYLPGLAMRGIADLYSGESKTDTKDAAVIPDAARTMPHTLRSLEPTDEITAELAVLVGYAQDLAAEATRTSNRIRGLLTQFHPRLARVLGPRLDHHAVTWLLERYVSPAALRKAGRRRLLELIRPGEQSVVVPGTGTLDIVIPSLARQLTAVHELRPPSSRAPRSTANKPPEAGTGSSNARCSCPRSPPCTTPPTAPTTTSAGSAAKPTPRPSSDSPAKASASCSPCSATAPSTSHGLDEKHGGTPRPCSVSRPAYCSPSGASLFGFFGGTLICSGNSWARPRQPSSTSAVTFGWSRHYRRSGLPAFGWRTRVSAPSIRNRIPAASA